MNTLAVVGLQWGDEGKGKIIDLLASNFDIIVRAQGGHNAGHSVHVHGKEFHFHLVPSGILNPKAICFIGGGTVVDPKYLLIEIEALKRVGIQLEKRLFISPYAHVIFPFHQRLDQLQEQGEAAIGTTGRGIGPCYADGVARKGIRVGELIDSEVFKSRLLPLLAEKNLFFRLYEEPAEDFDLLYEMYREYGKELQGYVFPFEDQLDREIKAGKKVLFEGAQGAHLDVRFGTYPFVTSSVTTSGGLAVGAGVGPHAIGRTIGVMKAYTTRVGKGPFPTEFSAEELSLFPHDRAREFGTTTGRKRRIGWLDIPLLKEAIRLNGVSSIALTKIDIFDSLDFIKICTAYKNFEYPPIFHGHWHSIEPAYDTLAGWKTSTREIKNVAELPKNARIFLNRIEELLECPIEILSFGPEREKTLFLE